MIVFAFGSVDTNTSDPGGSSAQPATSRQTLEPPSNDVPPGSPSEDGGAAESAVVNDPLKAARTELAAADLRLNEFDANNPRPKPSPGSDRIWFAAEGSHTFHGSAIDVGHDTVTLRAYKDGRTVEMPIAKLDQQHHAEIAELFADYQQAVADWNEKRRPLKEAVDERKKSLEEALAAKAEREREAERERQRIAQQKAVEAEAARKAATDAAAEAARRAEEEYEQNGLVLLRKTVQGRQGQFDGEITGTVINRRTRKLNYAQITFNLYDQSGAQVGSAVANINGLEPGGKWNFKATTFGTDFSTYKINELSGF